MKIVCVGCVRTGTTTFSECMRLLGFRHQSYNHEIVRQFMARNDQPAWDALEAFDSVDDWPFFTMYREIADRYPDAKFFLTTRSSPEKWLSSMETHTQRLEGYLRHIHRHFFGAEYPRNNRQAFLDYYNRHNEEVRRFFGDDLVEISWERGDGWDEICGALGLDVPDRPLPHLNLAQSQKNRERKIENWFLAKLEAREIKRFRQQQNEPRAREVRGEADPLGPVAPVKRRGSISL